MGLFDAIKSIFRKEEKQETLILTVPGSTGSTEVPENIQISGSIGYHHGRDSEPYNSHGSKGY